MALARVVEFEGVTRERLDEQHAQMEGSGPPEGFPPAEFVMLHDAAAEKSLVIFFLENEADYDQADAILNAMPAGETPGRRTGVAKYDVVFRMSS
jgi:hypothetical protein